MQFLKELSVSFFVLKYIEVRCLSLVSKTDSVTTNNTYLN